MSNPNQPPPTGPPPKKQTGSKTVLVGIIAAIAGLTIGGIGGSLAGDGATTASPAATVTARPTATMTIYKTAGQPTEEATEAPTDEPAAYSPKKSDWQIGIKILSNKCYDTAGASITYRIKPAFVGTVKPPEEGTVEVSYRVTGGEGGPSDNTFTVTGGQMSYDEEEDVSTPSCSTKLKAKVTDVSYTG